MPPVATELAIGDGAQADTFLMADELGDALVLDGRQCLTRRCAVAPMIAVLPPGVWGGASCRRGRHEAGVEASGESLEW